MPRGDPPLAKTIVRSPAEILREASTWSIAELHARVILYARACVRNGLISESRLARLAGLSQPHVHHLLHGARSLTPGAADALLAALGVRCTLDLYTTEELREYLDALTRPEPMAA